MEDSLNKLESNLSKMVDVVVQKLPSIAVGFVLLVVGIYVIRFFIRLIRRRFERRNVDLSIRSFAESIIKFVLYVLLILTVANTMGIQTTSFIAVLSAFGLAVGLALQGSLSNFAGGVLILLFRPFDVGDEIESANGSIGRVENIDLLYTTLVDDDGIRIYSPNGSLANSVIRNLSTGYRRMQFAVHVSYDTNIQQAREQVLAILTADPNVQSTPAPTFHVGDLNDSGMQVVIRAWVSHQSFLRFRGEIAEKVKVIFENQNIPLAKKSIRVIPVD